MPSVSSKIVVKSFTQGLRPWPTNTNHKYLIILILTLHGSQLDLAKQDYHCHGKINKSRIFCEDNITGDPTGIFRILPTVNTKDASVITLKLNKLLAKWKDNARTAPQTPYDSTLRHCQPGVPFLEQSSPF